MTSTGEGSTSKFNCKECNTPFETEEKLNLHLQNHSEVYCESCPIDIVIRGIKKLFTRKK